MLYFRCKEILDKQLTISKSDSYKLLSIMSSIDRYCIELSLLEVCTLWNVYVECFGNGMNIELTRESANLFIYWLTGERYDYIVKYDNIVNGCFSFDE